MTATPELEAAVDALWEQTEQMNGSSWASVTRAELLALAETVEQAGKAAAWDEGRAACSEYHADTGQWIVPVNPYRGRKTE